MFVHIHACCISSELSCCCDTALFLIWKININLVVWTSQWLKVVIYDTRLWK